MKRDPLNLALFHQLPAYLQARITPDPLTGCWLWTGPVTQNNQRPKCGITINGQWHTSAPRAVLAWLGLLGPGLQAAHKCPHRMCCRPDARHVYPADRAQQQRDRALFDENCRGERHPAHKLTEEAVRAIRQSRASHAALARQYGVAPPTVRAVRTGAAWKGVG